MSKAKKLDFTEERQIRRDLHDHEFMLSFNADDQCYAFNEWFYSEGQRLFIEYCKKEGIEIYS